MIFNQAFKSRLAGLSWLEAFPHLFHYQEGAAGAQGLFTHSSGDRRTYSLIDEQSRAYYRTVSYTAGIFKS